MTIAGEGAAGWARVTSGERAAGVDVGARRLHVVVVDHEGTVVGGRVVDTSGDGIDAAARWLAGTGVVRAGIDAPSALSTLPHAADTELSPKFRAARCGEVALGRDRGVWVPWVSPSGPPVADWVSAGLRLFAALGAHGVPAVETFPQAVFRALNGGGRVAAKSQPEGLAVRAALLAGAGVRDGALEVWSHDGLDAAACALVALGPSLAVTCGHDDSAIWLPA